jgi:uncharacterized protein HemX
MSDYTNDYENAAASLDLEPVVEVSEVPLVAAEEIVVEEQGYDIRDGDEIMAANSMANAVNYDLIILIVLVVALIGGGVFFFLKQRQGHTQVPTSDPEEQKVEEAEEQQEAAAAVESETIVETTKE